MLTKCPLCRDPLLPDAEEHSSVSGGSVSARSSVISRDSADASGGSFSRATVISRASAGGAAAEVGVLVAGDSGACAGNQLGDGDSSGGGNVEGGLQLTSIPERGSVELTGAAAAPAAAATAADPPPAIAPVSLQPKSQESGPSGHQ